MKDKLYQNICRKIEKSEPMVFLRWGDGEWNCILGRDGENCDGHHYYRSLSMALKSVLAKQLVHCYYNGMQPKAMHDMGNDINAYCDALKIEIPFVNADIFHDASTDSLLTDFFKACSDKNVVLVGPETLTMMQLRFPKLTHIKIPPKNAWLEHAEILKKLEEVLMSADGKTVVLFSCGMMANVLIDELWNGLFGGLIMLNMGSVFDPYCGRATRRYHADVIRKLGEVK